MLYIPFRRDDMQGYRLSGGGRKYRALRKSERYDADAADTFRFNKYNFIVKLIRTLAIFAVTAVALSYGFVCLAAESSIYSELYSQSGADELEDKAGEAANELLREFEISIDQPSSFANLNGFDLVKRLIEKSLSNIDSPFFALSSIIIMAAIQAVAFEASPIRTDSALCYILPCSSAVIISAALTNVITDAVNTVASCSVFMLSFVPIYAGVLTVCGKAATGGAYSALMFTVCQIFTAASDKLLIPLTAAMAASSIGSAFNELCGRLSNFIKKSAITVISFLMTAFTFILGMQTSISSLSDSVATKTAKTAMGAFIPIVGSALSDSLSVILGSMSLFKSSVGLYAMLCLTANALPTLLKILVWKAVLSVIGIVTQALGADSTSRLIGMLNGVLTLLMSIVLCCAAAYIISVALTLAAGG